MNSGKNMHPKDSSEANTIQNFCNFLIQTIFNLIIHKKTYLY